MIRVAIYEEATGAILALLSSSNFPVGLPVAQGCATLAVPDDAPDVSLETHMVVEGQFVLRPVDLAGARKAQYDAVKAFRDRVTDEGCPTPLGVVQTDPESRLKISGAVQMAMLAQAASQPFEVAWTMMDNSVVPHDAAQTIELGLAVGKHVNKAFEAATALRARIDAAETLEALEAVNIFEAPWPPNE